MNNRYRGFSVKSEKWIYGDLRNYKGNAWIVNEDDKEMVYQKSIGVNTGKKDINGKEIYTGHIAEISYTYPANDGERTTTRTCEIMWSEEMMGVVTEWGTDSIQFLHQVMLATEPEIKIIGDVFAYKNNTENSSDLEEEEND